MRVKVGNKTLRFRRRSAEGIVLKLSILSGKKRLHKGFKNEEEFRKWLSS